MIFTQNPEHQHYRQPRVWDMFCHTSEGSVDSFLPPSLLLQLPEMVSIYFIILKNHLPSFYTIHFSILFSFCVLKNFNQNYILLLSLVSNRTQKFVMQEYFLYQTHARNFPICVKGPFDYGTVREYSWPCYITHIGWRYVRWLFVILSSSWYANKFGSRMFISDHGSWFFHFGSRIQKQAKM